MKVTSDSTPCVSSGATCVASFSIAANKFAFDNLSNKLYTDKVRAVIRELACNAWDAHVAAGNGHLPFEVHLPTTHEPYFSINDYGTGLTHDEMLELFAMYFGSNKRGSNKFIGALGLGSKSPFAYKGNGGIYTIISRKDGVTRSYSASKDENGLPQLAQLGDAIATPGVPNGVMVQFAVDAKDIREFENKAKVALEFITPTPKFNVESFRPVKQEYILQNDKWALRKEAHTNFGYTIRAIMGNVQYQVGEIDQSRTNSIQRKILQMPIDMFFPLGELEFANNREALEMSDKTIAAVLGTCDRVYDEFIATVKAQIDACETLWDAELLVFSMINQTSTAAIAGGATMGGLISEAFNKGKLYGTYKNFTYMETSTKLNGLDYDHVGVTKFKLNPKATKRATKEPLFAYPDDSNRRDLRSKAPLDPAMARAHRYEITVEPQTLFVVNDLTVPGDKYVHYFLHEAADNGTFSTKCKKTVYVVHRLTKETEVKHVVKEGKKLIAAIGSPRFELMSSLKSRYGKFTDIPRTPGQRGGIGRGEVLVLHDLKGCKTGRKGWMRAWRTPTEIELALSQKFYVVIDKRVATDTRFGDAWDLEEFVREVRESGKFGLGSGVPVFGVKRGSKRLANNRGEFAELMSHVFSKVVSIMTPQRHLQMSLYLTPFRDSEFEKLLRHVAENQPLTSSPLQQFAVELADARGHKESNWKPFQWVLNFCAGRGKYTPAATHDFNKQWKRVKEMYPVLALLGEYQIGGNEEKIVEYVRLQDEQRMREAQAKAAASNS